MNNSYQNIDQLEQKPYSPNKIKEPEKINREEKTFPKKKENSKKNEKSYGSGMLVDEIEHPESLFSDIFEENTDDIKKNFYENKKKENLLVVGFQKNLNAKNAQIIEQKLKIEKDTIQLKENIGKVILNTKFMNDKNSKKNNLRKNNLLIKPEKVVNNFILEKSRDINIHNLKDCDINNNNNNHKKSELKKYNSLSIFQQNKNQKLINFNNKNQSQHQMGQIIKIPINLTAKDLQTKKQINRIPSPQKIMNNKEQKTTEKTTIHQNLNKSYINKIAPSKITKITSLNHIPTIQNDKNKSPQTTIKKITHNNMDNKNKVNQQKRNNNLNKIVISTYYNSSKIISRNSKNINLSFQKPQQFVKIISPSKFEFNFRKSDEIALNAEQKNKIKTIPIPFKANKNNDNQANIQFSSTQKEKTNSPYLYSDASNSIKRDFPINSININGSYNYSEKENYSNNLKFDNYNKTTIERGDKFNNNSTTYVVVSKTRSKARFPQPSRTIDTQNFQKTYLIPDLSKISLQQSPKNSPFQINQINPKSIPVNGKKTIKIFDEQNNSLKIKKNKSYNFLNTNNNYINVNYMNYTTNNNVYGANDLNAEKTKNNHYVKNKRINKPVIYRYNYGDNLWSDEAFFSYLNTS